MEVVTRVMIWRGRCAFAKARLPMIREARLVLSSLLGLGLFLHVCRVREGGFRFASFMTICLGLTWPAGKDFFTLGGGQIGRFWLTWRAASNLQAST